MYPAIGNTSSYIKQGLKAAYKLGPMACSAYLKRQMTETLVKRMKKLLRKTGQRKGFVVCFDVTSLLEKVTTKYVVPFLTEPLRFISGQRITRCEHQRKCPVIFPSSWTNSPLITPGNFTFAPGR